MTSPSPPEIINPCVITFPPAGLESETWASTHADEVARALRERGCFMAVCGSLDGYRSKLFKASKEIFGRLDKTNSSKREFAYIKNGQYESFDIPEATTDEGIKNFIPRMWPDPGGKDIRNDIVAYTKTAAEKLEKMVRKIVFGPDKLPKTGYRFQMMKYKEEARLAFPDHEDREEFLAVLDLNQDNDSEIRANINGRPFIIKVRPSTFLIMAGRPLKDWSEGKIHPPELRGNEERYSVGLFSYYDNKGKIDKGKNDKGRINDKGKIDKGRINDKGKIDKGRIDKVKTEAPKEQVERSRRS